MWFVPMRSRRIHLGGLRPQVVTFRVWSWTLCSVIRPSGAGSDVFDERGCHIERQRYGDRDMVGGGLPMRDNRVLIAVLRQSLRVLKPKGRCVFTYPNFPNANTRGSGGMCWGAAELRAMLDEQVNDV